ncbi:hypothetical protein BIT28_25110 [Photobacterium proteolyticum]|uniref:Uncharacterized protein n=1 Tax=Photobacterium proteolyticum TaxID=1903952 RepID=A0A1Q9H7P3_9GAMM|nr:efflux RND transporter periplasmic adaptor subunit [Photobacterium proteolyticum]OLQ83767.1 hypothetical protein BIT28_25110 [Photobacterium proteolyticum]
MKRDIYALITTITLSVALGFSLFLIITDNVLPFTTQATVKTTSVGVFPEVSGYIEDIYVEEGEMVHKGDLLFRIEPKQYQIAKDKTEALLLQAKNKLTEASLHYNRVKKLSSRSLVSKEVLDNAIADKEIAQAYVLSAQSDLNMAKLNLERTQIRAKNSGIVTNLTSSKGMYASLSMPVIHLVKGVQWIEVDFTEKGLNSLTINKEVNIVYDAVPNQVYTGKIIAIDQAIDSGITKGGQLGNVAEETRWIRPQQKIRVRVIPNKSNPTLIAGSRASVMIRGQGCVSDVWMNILSWLRFIY